MDEYQQDPLQYSVEATYKILLVNHARFLVKLDSLLFTPSTKL